MLVLFYFLAATPTIKRAALWLCAIVPIHPETLGEAAAIPSSNNT